MKRLASVILSICMALFLSAQENDVLKSLYNYLGAIVQSPLSVKFSEADFMIGVAAQSPDSALVTRTVFTWFKESPVMGDEVVALHVFDKWMAPASSPKKGGADAFTLAASLWAEINRASMIGQKAPEIALEALDGSYVELFAAKPEKPVILYFYDTSCSKCREEAPLFAQTDYPDADVYAIYTGISRDDWTAFIRQNFSDSRMIHLWDPNANSDKEVKYAVVGTPRMFLVDTDGVIAGRMLDPVSAKTLLESVMAAADPYSGLDETREFVDYVFGSLGDTLSRADISMVRELVRVKSLEKDRDTLSYKQLTAAIMQSLLQMRGPGPYEGLLDECLEDVLGAPDGIWTTQMDSLQVVEPARLFASIRSKCKVGEKLPKMWVKTTRGWKNLARCRGVNVIFFNSKCSSCLERIAKSSPQDVFVDIDAQTSRKTTQLLDSMDLSLLPMEFSLDGNGVIIIRAL